MDSIGASERLVLLLTAKLKRIVNDNCAYHVEILYQSLPKKDNISINAINPAENILARDWERNQWSSGRKCNENIDHHDHPLRHSQKAGQRQTMFPMTFTISQERILFAF
jgi:hypothetical protein